MHQLPRCPGEELLAGCGGAPGLGPNSSLSQGVPELFLVEEEYRLALLDAEAAFVERFIAQITDPETGWGPAWAAVT